MPRGVISGGDHVKNVTIIEIANRLGISRNTVSKAFLDDEIVADKTKERIVQEAIDMGYNKVPEALKLKYGKKQMEETQKIIILARREVADFWNRILLGISDVAIDEGYSFMIHFVKEDDEKSVLLPREVLSGSVAGIICLSIFTMNYFEKLFETKLPLVCYDSPLGMKANQFKADRVLVESYSGVYEITSKLLQDGRKNLCFIGDIYYCKTILDRWLGYKNAIRDFGSRLDEKTNIIEDVPNKYYKTEELIDSLEHIEEIPDAFVCSNDDIALNVIRFVESKGLKVPHDVAVSGFDDQLVLALKEYSLTTVHVDNEYLGKRMVEQLIHRIKNPERPFEMIYINTVPIFRNSTNRPE